MRNESGFEGLQGNPVWTEFQRQHASGRYDLDALWRASDQTGTTLTGDPMTPEVFKKEYDRDEDFYDAFHYIHVIDMDVMDVLCNDFERRLRDDPASVLLSMTENEKDDGPKFSSLFGAGISEGAIRQCLSVSHFLRTQSQPLFRPDCQPSSRSERVDHGSGSALMGDWIADQYLHLRR